MVGKIIAWFLKRAGYELTPAVEITKQLKFLDKKAREIDGVCCELIDDIEEMRNVEVKRAEPADRTAAQILNEYFYGYQPSRGDNE